MIAVSLRCIGAVTVDGHGMPGSTRCPSSLESFFYGSPAPVSSLAILAVDGAVWCCIDCIDAYHCTLHYYCVCNPAPQRLQVPRIGTLTANLVRLEDGQVSDGRKANCSIPRLSIPLQANSFLVVRAKKNFGVVRPRNEPGEFPETKRSAQNRA